MDPTKMKPTAGAPPKSRTPTNRSRPVRRRCREKTCRRQQYKNGYCAQHFRQFSGFSTVNFDAVSKGGKFDHNTMKDRQQIKNMTLKINKMGKKKKVMTMASLTARSKRGANGQKMDLMAMAKEYHREEAKKAALKLQVEGAPVGSPKNEPKPHLALDSPEVPVRIAPKDDSRFEISEMVQVLRSSGAWQDARITNITSRCFVCQFTTADGFGGTKEIPFSVATKMLRKKKKPKIEKKKITIPVKSKPKIEKKNEEVNTEEKIKQLTERVAQLKQKVDALFKQMNDYIGAQDFINAGKTQAESNAVKKELEVKSAELEKLLFFQFHHQENLESTTTKPSSETVKAEVVKEETTTTTTITTTEKIKVTEPAKIKVTAPAKIKVTAPATTQQDPEAKQKADETKKQDILSGKDLEELVKVTKEKLSDESEYKSSNHQQAVCALSRGEWTGGKQTLQLFSNGCYLFVSHDEDVYNITIGRWNVDAENEKKFKLILKEESWLQEKDDDDSGEKQIIKGSQKSGTMQFAINGELPTAGEDYDEDDGELSDSYERPELQMLGNDVNQTFEPSDRSLDPYDAELELSQQ